MSAPLPRPESVRAGAPGREPDWPSVRILDVEIDAGERSIPANHRRVRAIVHLGRLVPADVHVRAMVAHALADDVRRGAHAARLWSAQSYGNGTYVFEGHVPEPLVDDPGRLTVFVEPGRRPHRPPDR
ncbi:MAG: hypothetical protein ACYC2G_05150 [Gemmatimonadaceae bacterium]